jgi:uncharacterized protein (DUF58 family)
MNADSNRPHAPVATTPEHVLRRIDWKVIRRLDGALQGDYRTLFFGAGIDLSDLREYQPQDDIRHIDWNVTARMNSLHVRQYLEDRELTIWFLLDLSRSMRFGPQGRPKQAVQTDLVATFARLLTRGGNRVGAILYDPGATLVIPPRAGRKQILRLIHNLSDTHRWGAQGETDLEILLRAGFGGIRRRSLVFVVSDFVSKPGWERPLSQLSRRHEVLAIRVWDRRETALPDAGFVYFEDAETGEQIPVDTGDPVFRRTFVEAAARREATLNERFTRAGVDPYTISTEDDLVRSILGMAARRKARRR